MYKIYSGKNRFGKKVFKTYEDARKYVRRVITKTTGAYLDAIGTVGFSIRRD